MNLISIEMPHDRKVMSATQESLNSKAREIRVADDRRDPTSKLRNEVVYTGRTNETRHLIFSDSRNETSKHKQPREPSNRDDTRY